MSIRRLQVSSNYKLFEVCEFNRCVTKTKRLEASMRQHGYIPAYPLHCIRNGNGKLRIKAGHHRFVTARKLGIPVCYVVCEDEATIHELEGSTTAWSTRDYLESFARLGKPSYVLLKQYHEETGIPLHHCIALVAGETAGSGNQSARFKSGTYQESNDPSHRLLVADMVEHCKRCGVSIARNRLFVQAISRCLRTPAFDRDVFKARVKTNAVMLIKQPTLDATMATIETVYNRGSHRGTKVALCFEVDNVMQERSAVPVNKG